MKIVHIGYPKTGTKYLQDCVFPYIKGVKYMGYWASMETLRPIFEGSTPDFISSDIKIIPNALYSSERLVGMPMTGILNYEIAQRLRDVGFDKVIMVIRNHDTMIESLYRQYIQQGGVQKAKDFIRDTDIFRKSYLDYDGLIEVYIKIFGEDNVLILNYEDLLLFPEYVMEKMRLFCGSEEIDFKCGKRNVSLSYWSIKLLRIINHFTYNHYRKSNLISNRISTWKFRRLLGWIDSITRVLPKRKFYKS